MREYGNDTLTEVTFLVLLSFFKPNHGYEVIHFLDKYTNGRVKPGAGTLYGIINTLYKRGYIDLYLEDNRRKIYLITEEGKAVLKKEIFRLENNLALGKRIMEGGNMYEED